MWSHFINCMNCVLVAAPIIEVSSRWTASIFKCFGVYFSVTGWFLLFFFFKLNVLQFLCGEMEQCEEVFLFFFLLVRCPWTNAEVLRTRSEQSVFSGNIMSEPSPVIWCWLKCHMKCRFYGYVSIHACFNQPQKLFRWILCLIKCSQPHLSKPD